MWPCAAGCRPTLQTFKIDPLNMNVFILSGSSVVKHPVRVSCHLQQLLKKPFQSKCLAYLFTFSGESWQCKMADCVEDLTKNAGISPSRAWI